MHLLGSSLEIAQGLIIRHAPGHTPGLCILQVNMPESGTWIFTTDQYHVRENYEESHPQGWLARDHDDWVRSNQMIHMLAKRTGAKVILGHDKEVSGDQSMFCFAMRGANCVQRLQKYQLPGKEYYG